MACPDDLRSLSEPELGCLAAEIRELLVQTVARTGGHLGPNLGIVELTIALHRVFDSPGEPILFDVGHQAYVHKILTGRAAAMPSLRQTGGLSGYPSRAESPHDWIENSHASTALSYADGLAKARELLGEHRPVVAVVGDGALTGGMCWEALNNIAVSHRPVIIVVNDNGRSYAPTIGGLAERLASLRLRPGYERTLDGVKRILPRVPVVGGPAYSVLHGMKRGIKDVVAPHGLFEDLGLKYLGPVDGHDREAVEEALALARGFGGPVVVHCITRKGHGYLPAERDGADRMHQSRGFDPATGVARPSGGPTWTAAFSDELLRLGGERDELVAITAAMCGPTGLDAFKTKFPDRCYDVGIAEQHALTSAAGLALGGLHPVVAVYATFLNRAFDQLLMDVALHRLPVTVVLDRAGITGEDGPSHHGMWDLALLGVVPHLRVAAPRDEATLRAALVEAVGWPEGPTVLRFPKGVLPAAVPEVRRVGGVDVLAEPSAVIGTDVLIVAIGACATDALAAAELVRHAGYSVRVVDPRWVLPTNPTLTELAASSRLVVSVEDGIAVGGVGAQLSQALRVAGDDRPMHVIGIPSQFLAHGSVADVRSATGLTTCDIADRIIGWCGASGDIGEVGGCDRREGEQRGG